MGFQKFAKAQYPRRQWLIEGEAGSGKSTFLTQMRVPILPIDADQRFEEVLDLAQGDVYQLSSDPADNIAVDRIAEILQQQMPGSKIGTIGVDSLTTIVAPLVMQAIRGNDQGKNKNRVAAFKEKATAVRLLQDVVTGWGTDVAWVYHLFQGRDAKAQEQTNTSISELELSRLMRSVNMRIRLFRKNGVYAAQVVWARRGRSGMVLEDPSGHWEGMPEKIEAAVYDGLSESDQDRIETEPPAVFSSPAEAIRWGMDQGVFNDEAHAKNAYLRVKEQGHPASAQEMRDLWVADVQRRKANMEAGVESLDDMLDEAPNVE